MWAFYIYLMIKMSPGTLLLLLKHDSTLIDKRHQADFCSYYVDKLKTLSLLVFFQGLTSKAYSDWNHSSEPYSCRQMLINISSLMYWPLSWMLQCLIHVS